MGRAYDDPRYADIYKYPRGPVGVPPPGAYGGPYSGPYAAAPQPYAGPAYAGPPYASPPYAGPVPRERVYRDEDEGPDAYPGPRRYSYAEPTPPYAGRCAPRELVKQQLYRDGWRDFHDGDSRGGVATVRARRPSGRLFELTLDRCKRPGRAGRAARGPCLGTLCRRTVSLRSLCLRAAAAALGQGLLKAAGLRIVLWRPRRESGPPSFAGLAPLVRGSYGTPAVYGPPLLL